MVFSARLPLSSLIELCRTLRHSLGAGLPLRDVFHQQARRGPSAVRPVAERISQGLKRGDALEDTLKREQAAFPPLFLALASVGEHTGNLPETFAELEKYFLLQQRLRRQFVAQIAWPVFQFVAAVFIIAGLILVMGVLVAPQYGPDSSPPDPLGLGLMGVSGALLFLAGVVGLLAVLTGLYLFATRALRQSAAVDGVLLAVPILGPCLRALALARFCLALRMTLDTGLPIATALRLSLRATGNEAFAARSPAVEKSLRSGDDLALALAGTGLFSEEFQNIVAVGEESGRLPEVMDQQAQHYQEAAGRRLTVLTVAASVVVWLVVAIAIIVVVFRLFAFYLKMIDPATHGL